MVGITELDLVLKMSNYPLDVARQAYTEMKKQDPYARFKGLLEKGIDPAFAWYYTPQGRRFWSDVYYRYENRL